MVEIDIVRHGQTQFNVEKRVQGLADSELTAQGIADAQALGRGFKKAGISFDQAYSSDRKTCCEDGRVSVGECHTKLSH
ncbi:phosphoglycerate mutase family protein [Lacticaseibacillus saniviri]|uniref:phosphoglycerate mutase family protein n=1 Tax=Lacticaseibacillus saniviri TaxID=931533 RepID=UPI0009E9C41E|nr:histidine phosphatase family protein [Lacticaseibacillus saniviri]